MMPRDDDPVEIRWIAACFAVIATIWGLLLMIVLPAPHPVAWGLCFSGYVMTVGYWYRAMTRLPLFWRRGIWGFSLLVQGGFTALSVCIIAEWGRWLTSFAVICIIWWWITTVVSALCLIAEAPDLPEDAHYP